MAGDLKSPRAVPVNKGQGGALGLPSPQSICARFKLHTLQIRRWRGVPFSTRAQAGGGSGPVPSMSCTRPSHFHSQTSHQFPTPLQTQVPHLDDRGGTGQRRPKRQVDLTVLNSHRRHKLGRQRTETDGRLLLLGPMAAHREGQVSQRWSRWCKCMVVGPLMTESAHEDPFRLRKVVNVEKNKASLTSNASHFKCVGNGHDQDESGKKKSEGNPSASPGPQTPKEVCRS